MNSKKDCPPRFNDDLAIEVARSIRLFERLVFLASVSNVGIDIVRIAAEDLLSSIADHDHSLGQLHKTNV